MCCSSIQYCGVNGQCVLINIYLVFVTQGDSGGPLACFHNNHWLLTAVVSTGHDCGQADYPGLYTMVKPYKDWIERTMNNN